MTENAYDSTGSTFTACSYYPACRDILPSARIFLCIHIRLFISLAEMKFFLLAPAKRVHFSHAAQQLSDVGVFLYLFARKRIALISNIFDTFAQYQHEAVVNKPPFVFNTTLYLNI